MFDGCMCVKYFGGSTPPKHLTDMVPSNIWGVYTPKIFDGYGSVKYLGGVYTAKIFDECMCVKYLAGLHPQKYLMGVCPSNVWGVYTPKIFDGCMSVKCLRGLHPQNI